MTKILMIGTGFLNQEGLDKINSVGIDTITVRSDGWILGVTLPNGQTVAAYPISRLNLLAPPEIYMTDNECTEGVDNRKPAPEIARKLKRWCDDESLTDAIKLLKTAIKSLET